MMDRQKKVFILGPAYPFRGGIADTNEALARAMQKAGWNVQLITFTLQYPSFLFPGETQYKEGPAPKGLNIKRMISSVNPLTWFNTAKYINLQKPDLVVIRYWLPFMAPCLGLIARLSRFQVVGITDNVIPHESSILHALFTPFFLSSCDKLMALSESVEQDLKSLSNKPTTFYPHPINDQFDPKIPKAEARKRLNLQDSDRIILFFGFVRKYKGLDLLIDSMAQKAFPQNVKLIIAGEFYDNPEEYNQLIERYNLADRVIVHNRFISDEDIPAFFCAADLVTQTYRTATQSGITQMALHYEIPVLVTRVGGLDEFVEEGKTGLFAEVEASDIAKKIRSFFDADQMDMVENIRLTKEKYSWDTFVHQLNQFAHG